MDFFSSFIRHAGEENTLIVSKDHSDQRSEHENDDDWVTITSSDGTKQKRRRSNAFEITGRIICQNRDLLDELTEIRNFIVWKEMLSCSRLKKIPIEVLCIIQLYLI